METLFLACAVLGGTVLVVQFILTLVGMGHHDVDFDHDVAAHFDAHDHDAAHSHADHANWFFKAVSVRTLVAAVTFFGLCGLAAVKAGRPSPQPILIGVACGIAAMYGVYFVMQSLYRLKADGTERIERAVGAEGTVYLTIPAARTGQGKIHFSLQNRLVEYAAVTAGEALPAGTKVTIVDVSGHDTVEVVPLTIQNTASVKHG